MLSKSDNAFGEFAGCDLKQNFENLNNEGLEEKATRFSYTSEHGYCTTKGLSSHSLTFGGLNQECYLLITQGEEIIMQKLNTVQINKVWFGL